MQIDRFANERELWSVVAKKHGWYSEPFYVQVWLNEDGTIQDSVSFRGMTQDIVVNTKPKREIVLSNLDQGVVLKNKVTGQERIVLEDATDVNRIHLDTKGTEYHVCETWYTLGEIRKDFELVPFALKRIEAIQELEGPCCENCMTQIEEAAEEK